MKDNNSPELFGKNGPAAYPSHNNSYGWKSPVYSESGTRSLDPQHLKNMRCIGTFQEIPDTNYYKVLKTQVHQLLKLRGWNTVMVTSPHHGEGKTVTSINLSFTFAQDYSHTVMLIDCDLKQQQVHKYLGVSSDRGLAEYLIDDVPLKDLIIWPGVDKFTFVSGGGEIIDSMELLNSPRMASLVQEIRNRYTDRFIIFDAPPLLEGADAMAFLPMVEGVLLVVEAGKTARKSIEKSLELIPKEKFLGFALNRQILEGRKTGEKSFFSFLEKFRKEQPSR